MMMMWMDRVRHALKMELRQIHHLARLAMMAPNEVAREMVLHLISEELQEAMFWSHVLCAYSDMAMPVSPGAGFFPQPGIPFPGMGPGLVPPAGPGATLPPSVPIGPVGGPGTFPGNVPGILPGIPLSQPEKKDDKK